MAARRKQLPSPIPPKLEVTARTAAGRALERAIALGRQPMVNVDPRYRDAVMRRYREALETVGAALVRQALRARGW